MKKLDLKYKVVFVLALLLFSCHKEEPEPDRAITDTIKFSVNGNAGSTQSYTAYAASTKGAEDMLLLVSSNGNDTLALYLSESETVSDSDTTATKGTPVSQNNLIEICEGEIAVRAFYKNEGFIDDVLVFEENGDATTRTASYWPVADDATVDFWSYHPKETTQAQNFTISNSETAPALSFYYNLRKGEENILVDATEQKDLFVAYTRQGKEQGEVNLNYLHALSAVKFAASKALPGKILKITISDICAGGTLTYSPKGETKLTWVLDENRYTLDQSFDKAINENLSGDYSQTITQDINSTIFMLMPQTLKDNTFTIDYQREGEENPTTYTATIPEGKWEAGKSYTYTLSLMDGLGIDINTPANNEGFKIRNTNNKPCYIRAMIIANWVDEEGNVAAIFYPDETDLEIKPDNNYKLSADWGTYWFHNEESNIYYYKKILRKGENTVVNLFDEFTNPSPHPEGLKLDFTVLVQAVEAESSKASVTEAWGETIAGQLE